MEKAIRQASKELFKKVLSLSSEEIESSIKHIKKTKIAINSVSSDTKISGWKILAQLGVVNNSLSVSFFLAKEVSVERARKPIYIDLCVYENITCLSNAETQARIYAEIAQTIDEIIEC